MEEKVTLPWVDGIHLMVKPMVVTIQSSSLWAIIIRGKDTIAISKQRQEVEVMLMKIGHPILPFILS